MARSFIQLPKTAEMAAQTWSSGLSGKSLPVFFLIACLNSATSSLS